MQEKKGKKSKFLLFAAAFVTVSAIGLGTGACSDAGGGGGSDSGNHKTDYSEITGARVSEFVWEAAFLPAKYANASVKWKMKGVTSGTEDAAENTAVQNIDLKIDANKAYLHAEESGKLPYLSLSYSSEKYFEYIKSDVPNIFFDQSAEISAEDFNVYEKTGDEWQKYSLADDDADWEFDMSSPIFDVFFPDFSGKYKSGKYSEAEKGYVFENVEATLYSGLNGEFECDSATFDKVVIKLVNGRAAAMQATVVATRDNMEIKGEICSVIYDIGTTKVDLPSVQPDQPDQPDQPGRAAKINSLLPSDKEIGKAYSEAFGEKVTEAQWRQVFNEELYQNVSVNMWGGDEDDRTYYRYRKAGDLGWVSMSYGSDFGIETTYSFYVRRQDGKSEYLVPFDIDRNWRCWYTEEEFTKYGEVGPYAWEWNMFGYIVFGDLENQFSAFTFNPETGEYVGKNITVTQFGESGELSNLTLKIVDGKLTALFFSVTGNDTSLYAIAASFYVVITDIGTTEINISDRVSSQAELDAAFYYLIDQLNVYYAFRSTGESGAAYVQVEGEKALVNKWPKRYYLGKVNGEERAYYYSNGFSGELQKEDDDKTIRVQDLLSVFSEVYSGVLLDGYDEASGMYVNNHFSYNGKAAVLRVKFFGGFVRYFEIDYGDTKDEYFCWLYGDTHADLPRSAGFNFDEPDSGITKEAFFAELEKREEASFAAKKWATVNVKGTLTKNGKVEKADYKNLDIYHNPGDVSVVPVENADGGILCYVFNYSTKKNDSSFTTESYEQDGSFLKVTLTMADDDVQAQGVMIFNADGYVTYYKIIIMIENGTKEVYEFIFSGYSGEISED